MLTGKSFRLKKDLLALEWNNGVQTAQVLPSDSIVHVVADGNDANNHMVDLECSERQFAAFAVDIQERGEPVDNNANVHDFMRNRRPDSRGNS